jgi:hypothetical protein
MLATGSYPSSQRYSNLYFAMSVGVNNSCCYRYKTGFAIRFQPGWRSNLRRQFNSRDNAKRQDSYRASGGH